MKLSATQIVRVAFVTLLSACLSFTSMASPVLAQSSTVTANIPSGYIAVQGKTSPSAQVKIYENGNELPAASIVANASGEFNEELPQDSPGIVDISIRAVDTDGKQSVLITKPVAVIAQQTSTLTVILPPTATVSPNSVVFRSGTLNFSGQTIPSSTIKITVEPSMTLSATSDSQGKYTIPLLVESLRSVGTYTYGVEVDTGSEISDYAAAGTFTVLPPTQPPIDTPDRPVQEIVDTFTNRPPAPPEITYPSEAEFTSADPLVITGRSNPGTLISIYDNDTMIGTVVTGEDGTWQFYFSPYKELHSLHAQACLNGRCSENSRTIKIRRPDSGTLQPCRAGIALNEYRLKTTAGEPLGLSGTLPEGRGGALYISWGDDNNERFDSDTSDQFKVTHSYERTGVYSGYIMLDDSQSCQSATYFAVEVTEANSTAVALILLVLALIIGLLCFKWLAPRLMRRIKA